MSNSSLTVANHRAQVFTHIFHNLLWHFTDQQSVPFGCASQCIFPLTGVRANWIYLTGMCPFTLSALLSGLIFSCVCTLKCNYVFEPTKRRWRWSQHKLGQRKNQQCVAEWQQNGAQHCYSTAQWNDGNTAPSAATAMCSKDVRNRFYFGFLKLGFSLKKNRSLVRILQLLTSYVMIE